MSMFSCRLGLAFIVAALGFGAPAAQAQSGPLGYWTPGWPIGYGNMAASQNLDTYGNFPSFDGQGAGYTRYNFKNGAFIGGEGGTTGLNMNGFSQSTTFGSLNYSGVQFGYNLQNSPVTFFGGVDTFRYDTGIGGNPLAPFSSASTNPGYTARAGVEFRPTSNVSLSLGMSYTQQSRGLDTDTPSPSFSNTSQFDLVGGRH
jgi:opacity protein-like surface antigen